MKILTKYKPRPEDKGLIERKKRDHEKIIQKNDKDLWELDRNTYKVVTDKIKTKNKNVFNLLNRAGPAYNIILQ